MPRRTVHGPVRTTAARLSVVARVTMTALYGGTSARAARLEMSVSYVSRSGGVRGSLVGWRMRCEWGRARRVGGAGAIAGFPRAWPVETIGCAAGASDKVTQ